MRPARREIPSSTPRLGVSVAPKVGLAGTTLGGTPQLDVIRLVDHVETHVGDDSAGDLLGELDPAA